MKTYTTCDPFITYIFLVPLNDFNNREISKAKFASAWKKYTERLYKDFYAYTELSPSLGVTRLYREISRQIAVSIPVYDSKKHDRVEKISSWMVYLFSQQQTWIEKRNVNVLSTFHMIWTGTCAIEENISALNQCKRKILELLVHIKKKAILLTVKGVFSDLEKRYSDKFIGVFDDGLDELEIDGLIEIWSPGYYKLTRAGQELIENDSIKSHSILGFYLGILKSKIRASINFDVDQKTTLEKAINSVLSNLGRETPNEERNYESWKEEWTSLINEKWDYVRLTANGTEFKIEREKISDLIGALLR
ncbi:hypothetical protein [Gimesia panareensis]|uniref:hypothetical protein n=1 Tax=Gimesia panareensis TaxID=2527978 RepID=UPI0011877520|nr:hypothetical protein [Gimesia panareensis]QDU52123.1 hypothetical protein Pan110_44950 [Gimesia panareensis]